MTTAGPRRSTLATALLALLVEAPMHPYRMQQVIKERGQDQLVNVAQRNSVYQALDRLVRDGLGRAGVPRDPAPGAGAHAARGPDRRAGGAPGRGGGAGAARSAAAVPDRGRV